MIDLHTHVLPGLDDGAVSVAGSVEILRALAADGVTAVAATPHVRSDYPTTPDRIERSLERVRRAAASAGLRIELLPGAELAFERLASLDSDDLKRFALAGNPQFLLIEFPNDGWPPDLARQLVELLDAGIQPVLAHPERNAEVQAAPSRLAPLVSAGVLVQVAASSLVDTTRRKSWTAANTLVDTGLAHIVASDSHSPRNRPSMSLARQSLREERLATWLTVDVPAAIASGADIVPARPLLRPRAFSLLRH